MATKKPLGTDDLLGVEALTWSYMRDTAAEVFTRYGYQQIEIPMFEQTDVFVHGLGTATDVVRKEMFTVLSPDGYAKVSEGRAEELKAAQRLSLRPEGTAGAVRCLIENSLVPQGGAPAKLWYGGSMFRAERPQKGRLREFHQIGAEFLGASDPAADAETIMMLVRFVQELGIPAEMVELRINSMGDDACRPAYRESVAAYIREHSGELCEECNRRAETNPLRAFDCKNEHCHEVMEGAPSIADALCDECRAHYATVKSYLDAQGISYIEDPRLVRGLDYYTRTVFEASIKDGLGSQNAIGGGGRYDKLVEVTGGKPTPGLGFAMGFERIVLAMKALGAPLPEAPRPDVFVAITGSECAAQSFNLVAALRDSGFIVEADRQGRSLKGQFKLADKYDAGVVVVIGPDELAKGCATVRHMESHQEACVDLDEVAITCAGMLGWLDEEEGGCGCGDPGCGHDHHHHDEGCGCGC